MKKKGILLLIVSLGIFWYLWANYSFPNRNHEQKVSSTNKASSNSQPSASEKNTFDSITTIKFPEFSLTINSLVLFDDNEAEEENPENDTIRIYADLGETIEGQLISILSDKITNIQIFQRYETSVTIMDEGPHCDLINWKHYNSDWKELKPQNNGQYLGDKYNEKDYEKFPNIPIDELKNYVKDNCGETWFKLIEKIKSPKEYPSGVGVSRYFLRVTGQHINDNTSINKIIIIEIAMGC